MKPGRNQLCPCGSGKKYKKCCINKTGTHLKTNTFEDFREVFIDDGELIQLFGYSTPRNENESPFELPEDGLCCMVSRADQRYCDEINPSLTGKTVKPGGWCITANIGESVKFDGPYPDEETAMNRARELFGAVRFVTLPSTVF